MKKVTNEGRGKTKVYQSGVKLENLAVISTILSECLFFEKIDKLLKNFAQGKIYRRDCSEERNAIIDNLMLILGSWTSLQADTQTQHFYEFRFLILDC